jgi:hypothetical protein
MQKELDELNARVQLSKVKDAVITAVAKLNHQAKLAECLSAVNTKPITLKSSELTEKFVSKALVDALNGEFKELDVGQLSVSLTSRSEKGKTIHKQQPGTAIPGHQVVCLVGQGHRKQESIVLIVQIHAIGQSGQSTQHSARWRDQRTQHIGVQDDAHLVGHIPMLSTKECKPHLISASFALAES